MKKTRLIIGLFLATITLFIGCQNKKNLENVLSIEVIPSKFLEKEALTYVESSATSFKAIIEFINEGLRSETTTDHATNNDIIFKLSLNNEAQRVFSVDFDLTSQKAYLIEGENTYLINSEATTAFTSNSSFSDYFTSEFTKPQLQLNIDQKSMDFYYQTSFQYAWFNKTKQNFTDHYDAQSADSELLIPMTISTNTPIEIAFDHQPDRIIQKNYSDDVLVSSNEVQNNAIITPTIEGKYRIDLECTWDETEDRKFSGNATYSFLVSLDIPITFLLNQTSAYPGDTFTLLVSGVSESDMFTVNAPFYNKEINFYPYKDGYVGLIPIYAWLTPATYQIEATINGTNLIKTFDVEVLPKAFDIQHITVDESTTAIFTNDNSAKDQVYFDKARANPIQEKLWEGAFIQPVEGTVTTDYCSTRYTNDNPTPSRHLAIDIANDLGTPIMASNNGKVVLARELIITGNTIVIDHGMGIFTSSFHLSEISANEGDFVSKGDMIGKMGTTGYSTGSHLHFAIWKDGTFLNPWTFFDMDPIGF